MSKISINLKYIVFTFVIILSGFVFTNSAFALSYVYTCPTGGTITSVVNIGPPNSPYPASNPTQFDVSAYMTSTCAPRNVTLEAQNNFNAPVTLIPVQNLNPGFMAGPYTNHIDFISPSTAGSSYAVHFWTGVYEAGGGGGGYGGGFTHCFVADTQVTMADGTVKNIQDVQIGDVLKGATSNNKVIGFHQPKLGEDKLYSFNGGRYFVTAEHPFATTEGWKSLSPAKTAEEHLNITVTQLEIGDTLVTEDGLVVLNSIDSKSGESDTQLYNFKLDGDHTYYADGYLVHNKVECQASEGGTTCGGGLYCTDATPPPNGNLAVYTGSGQCSIGCITPEPNPAAYCAAHPHQGSSYFSFCSGYDYNMHYCTD